MAPTQPADVLQTVSAIPEPVRVPLPPKDRPVFAATGTMQAVKAAPVARPPQAVFKAPQIPLPTQSDEPSFNELLDNLQKEGRE
jgi:hypothetical protein